MRYRGFRKFLRGPLNNNSPVLGPNRIRCRSCEYTAQNRLDFQPNPSNGPRNVNTPHKTHKAPHHIINSLIGVFMQMRTEWMFQGPNTSRPWCGVGGGSVLNQGEGGTRSTDFVGHKEKVYFTPSLNRGFRKSSLF